MESVTGKLIVLDILTDLVRTKSGGKLTPAPHPTPPPPLATLMHTSLTRADPSRIKLLLIVCWSWDISSYSQSSHYVFIFDVLPLQ